MFQNLIGDVPVVDVFKIKWQEVHEEYNSEAQWYLGW